jgi:hypothetical protein
MTYRPAKRIAFGPPLNEQAFALTYLAFAVVVSAVIFYGQELAPSTSALFRYVVEGDRNRVLPSSVCAIVLCTSAFAAILREQMRGVVVHPDGIELRELLGLGWPRVRRLHWSQIDRVVVPAMANLPATAPPSKGIRLDLWDGTHTFLPHVARSGELGQVLERVALARAIPLEGGTGLLDDLEPPLLS